MRDYWGPGVTDRRGKLHPHRCLVLSTDNVGYSHESLGDSGRPSGGQWEALESPPVVPSWGEGVAATRGGAESPALTFLPHFLWNKGFKPWKNSVALSYRVKYTLTICLGTPTPRYLPKWFEKLCSHKNLYTNIYGIFFFCNHPNVKTIHMFFNQWVGKQWMCYLHTEESTQEWKQWATDSRSDMDSHDSTSVIFQKRRNYVDRKQLSSCQGQGVRERVGCKGTQRNWGVWWNRSISWLWWWLHNWRYLLQ